MELNIKKWEKMDYNEFFRIIKEKRIYNINFDWKKIEWYFKLFKNYDIVQTYQTEIHLYSVNLKKYETLYDCDDEAEYNISINLK